MTTRRARLVAATVALVAGSLAVAVADSPARASSTAGGNPWIYRMSQAGQDGLVVQGDSGPGDSSVLMVKDYAGQPIFNVLKAGGAAVLGDNFRVMAGSDIFHAQVTLSPSNPDPAVCVRNGQLWIGGPAGDMWRCANLGHGYAWWPVIS